jgi:zinc transport system substrate-binding protein
LATGLATVVAAALVLGLVPGVAAAASKRSVVAAFYPVAYAAQRIGGDRVDVTNLTPAGAEPHDLELNPDQIDKVLDADLVVDLGQGFQPAVEKAAEQRDGPTVSLLRPGTKDRTSGSTRCEWRGSCAPSSVSSRGWIRRDERCTHATRSNSSPSSRR